MQIPGKWYRLTVDDFKDQGAYLKNDDMRVLLLRKDWPENIESGMELDVFLYKDSENRPLVTTEKPKIELNQIKQLEVTDTFKHGAFVDWGLPRDLFVPHKEQGRKLEKGDKPLVVMYYDPLTDRLAGSTRIDKHITNENIELTINEEVEIQIWKRGQIGWTCIIEGKWIGMLYSNEVFQPLKTGQITKAIVKKIRDDNKIDLRLNQVGKKSIFPNQELILNKLKEGNGFIPLNDESSPEEIYNSLGISKKAFKKAIGNLYKKQRIDITVKGIKYNKSKS